MKPRLNFGAAFLLAIAGSSGSEVVAEPSRARDGTVMVVAARRDLAAGEVVGFDDIVQRAVPTELVTSSVVKPDSASYIVKQPINLPVLKGDLMLWSFFETFNGAAPLSKRCRQIAKEEGTAVEQIAKARQRALAHGRP